MNKSHSGQKVSFLARVHSISANLFHIGYMPRGERSNEKRCVVGPISVQYQSATRSSLKSDPILFKMGLTQ